MEKFIRETPILETSEFTAFTAISRKFLMPGRTFGKCRLHGKMEPLKGHKRVCPFGNCFCYSCTTHNRVLAMKYLSQGEVKEERGRRWRTSPASKTNIDRRTATTTNGTNTATSTFPKMGSSAPNADDSMLAHQVANFKTVRQITEKTTQDDQRKGELLCCDVSFYQKSPII